MFTRIPRSPLQDIYDRLNSIGLNDFWIKENVLPQWFEDQMAAVPATRSEIEIHLARTLNIDLASLRDPTAPIRFIQPTHVRFKSHRDAPTEKECITRALGAKLGQIAASGAPKTHQPLLGRTASEIRQRILETGVTWIGLRELLTFCWDHHVPVIKATLPDGFKKWDGMALAPFGRRVILSFSGKAHSSWHSFIVAHELAHHILGHVPSGSEILDDNFSAGDDADEKAVNQFAATLLTGLDEKDNKFTLNTTWPNADRLVEGMMAAGQHLRVDPGAILLNMSHHNTAMRPLCIRALGMLEKEPVRDIYSAFYGRLDADDWADEEYDFFERLTESKLA